MTVHRHIILASLWCALLAHGGVATRYIRIEQPKKNSAITFAELAAFGKASTHNLALGQPTAQSGIAQGGEPSRAVDGSPNAHGNDKSCCQTTNCLNGAWWEVDLGESKEVKTINILNRLDRPHTLDSAFVRLLNAERQCIWSTQLSQEADYKISLTITPKSPSNDAIGRVIPRTEPIRENPKLVEIFCLEKAPSREQLVVKLFNREALARAIRAYAQREPKLYPDRDQLLQQLAQLDASDFKAIDRFMQDAYFRLPELKRIKEIIYIQRTPLALPSNWQGNSSRSVSGYDSAIIRRTLLPTSAPQTLLTSSATLTDLTLDFDASRIAFSTRKPGLSKRSWSGYCVAEMRLDQPGVFREISPTNQLDIDYYDPAYLPNGNMLMVGTSGFQGVPCVSGNDYVGNLLLLSTNGTVRRLSYDQDNNWSPVVLPSGRCLYLRWEYADSAHYFSRILMTMNPDGTHQQEYYGSNSYWPNSLFYARPLPGSDTKFMGIVSGHHGEKRKGDLVLFDVDRGRRETDGAVQRIPGWGKPVLNETKDELVSGREQYFLHPFPINDSAALVSMQHCKVSQQFFLALVDIYDVQYPLAFEPHTNLLHPIPLIPQPRPPIIPDAVDLSKKTSIVNIVDIYNGPGLAGVPRGTVKKLRLYSFEYSPRKIGGHYLIGIESGWDPRIILGEVDVEPDGSCLFEVPANTPIALQPLDDQGRHLQEMRSWFATMPGETFSCIGCHEMQNSAAPNKPTLALTKPPRQIKGFYGPRRGFDFSREVQNVLDRRCAGCHNGAPTKKNKLGQPLPNFTYKAAPKPDGFECWGGKIAAKFRSPSYDALHPYVRRNGPEGDYHLLTPLEFHASTSELFQRLEKGHHGVELTPEEWERLLTWAGLNVPYFGTWTELNANQKTLARRREMNRLYSNDDYDPEVIVNPYRPVTFEPPAKKMPRPAPIPFVATVQGGTNESREVVLTNGAKIKLRRIPAGTYVMGSNLETPQECQRLVTITNAFWMSETEVSVAQFRCYQPQHDNGVYDMFSKDQVHRGYYMNDYREVNPRVKGEDPKGEFPVVRITWHEAQAFCQWLSKLSNQKVRLPTEEEWEWSCRAGSGTPFSFGDYNADFSPYANLAGEENVNRTVMGIDPKPWKGAPKDLYFFLRDSRFNDGVMNLAKCGSFKPNQWGLKDMHGNVAEWTASDYPTKGSLRKVVRGGSFNDRSLKATSSWRWGYPAWMKPFDVGFRIVIEE